MTAMRAPSPGFDIPEVVSELLAAAAIAEYAYLTPRGAPLCWPVTPYWYPDRGVLGIATGLAYPNKAYYARSHPRVSVLFDAGGSGSILLQGEATVLDEDLQANTDRYVREMRAKFLSARLGLNPISVRLLDFYLPRVWVEITPTRLVMSRGDSEVAILGAPLDGLPGPTGVRAESLIDARLGDTELRALWAWVRRQPTGTITTVGRGSYPAMLRSTLTPGSTGRLSLDQAPGVGAACLTLHSHHWGGVRLDALMARGVVERSDHGLHFTPRRAVGFMGRDAGSRPPFLSIFPLSQFPRAAELRHRLARELAARGEPLPRLRVPR